MEVSHREDLVTHAVISTNEAQGFGMSDSAEFFNILSSTLYKNQHLAVIRETLCNAWDAHIDSGRTHLPVEVTLTHERLIIRDFGKGIPDAKMRDVYCVYGSSTKAHDGKQTGGFGLGCKAPFAYADHFEVISNHDGVKTIYNMSKSNAQAGGKPGMIKLASLPTGDTGLQVTIDIRNHGDYGKFDSLIRKVVFQGDMRVKLNEQTLPTIGFDVSKSNMMLVPFNTFTSHEDIYVRYGNVIYPVEHSEALADISKEVKTFLKSLVTKNLSSPYIIFQAPPHSISVQPSREGLSMKEHTTNTLQGLMQDFMKQVKKEFLPHCLKIRVAEIQAQVKEGDMVKLLDARKGQFDTNRHHNDRQVPSHLQSVQTMEQIAARAMSVRPPEIPGYREKDLAIRIQTMAQAGMLDRGLASTFLRELANQVKDPGHLSDWLTRRVLAPLTVGIQGAGLMVHRLYVKDRLQTSSMTTNDTLSSATLYKETRLVGVAPFLRNILVVTHKLSNLEIRIHRHHAMDDQGAAAKILVYHCGASKADKEKSLAFFRAQPGLKVIDLTQNQAWEDLGRAAPVAKKPKKEGLPALACIWNDAREEINTSLLLHDGSERITNPEFVCLISLGRSEPSSWINNWNNHTTRILVELFGKRGAIVNHRGKYDTAIKNGAVDFNTFIYTQLKTEITTNPRIKKYLQFMPLRLLPDSSDRDARDILTLAYNNTMLQKKFKLPAPLTPRDLQFLKLWEKAVKGRYNLPPILQEIRDYIEAVPLHDTAKKMVATMQSSPLRDVLDLSHLETKIRLAEPGTSEAKQMDAIMQLLFNP